MWIVKGVLLGVVIFIVAGISYILIRVGITKYRIAQAGGSHYYHVAFHARWLIHLWSAIIAYARELLWRLPTFGIRIHVTTLRTLAVSC